MAFANKIRQIVRLKQVMHRWKTMSLICGVDSGKQKSIPSGSLGVYVGIERQRFVIPTRYLKLPLFVSLLKKAEEEYGFHSDGGLAFPCEVEFFRGVLKLLGRDEDKFGGIGLDDFVQLFNDDDGGDTFDSFESLCKDPKSAFIPLLHHKAAATRV